MLEDINNALNTGDVPKLYEESHMGEIKEVANKDCKKKGIEPTPTNMFSMYLTNLLNNLHFVLAMSPLNKAFNPRLRMFPSLVNCTSIDYFAEWPEEALLSVADGEISEEMKLEEQRLGIVETFSKLQKSVEVVSVEFRQELKRNNYVTPASYLELISL